METILKVTREGSECIAYFQNFESFFVEFFSVFRPDLDSKNFPIIHFDINLSSNSFDFYYEDVSFGKDIYHLSTITVL